MAGTHLLRPAPLLRIQNRAWKNKRKESKGMYVKHDLMNSLLLDPFDSREARLKNAISIDKVKVFKKVSLWSYKRPQFQGRESDSWRNL